MTTFLSDILQRFKTELPEAESRLLAAAIDRATSIGASLFLVGGSVRDLLLGRPSRDIDVAVEGDVLELLQRMQPENAAKIVQHGRFGTATLRGAGFHIDFARTRRESYPRPGSLPEVEASSIQDDLARRDFTVNSIALRLTQPEAELLDPFGGRNDLARKLIRVLHQASFQDDSTRMLRACRYAARLGFTIGPDTISLIQRDLTYLETISGARLRQELSLMFKETAAVESIQQAGDLGILRGIHPLLALEPPAAASWREAIEVEHHASLEQLGFAMVSQCQTDTDVDALSARLHLTGRLELVLRDLVRLNSISDKLDRPDLDDVAAVDLLDPHTPPAVWAFGLKAGGLIRERCLTYLDHWRRVRLSLDGTDLQALGIAPGPELGRALKRLREARIRGEVSTRQDEEAVILREFVGRLGS